MLDLRYVVENLDEVKRGLARRGPKAAATLDQVKELAEKRRSVITRLEQLRSKKNDANAEMARLDKKSPEFAAARDAMRAISDETKQLEQEQRTVETALEDLLLVVPNVPHESVPDGADEHANVVVRTWGKKPELAFKPKDHHDLGTALGILDFERAAKISGARFTVLRGAGARLERALMQFMLDLHTNSHGYEEVWTPVLVKDSAMRGTGQLPKFAKDAFKIEVFEEGEGARNLYLAPTAEVPVTNMYGDEIIDGQKLPLALTAYTACFRSEAGSYGKDTRGLIRQHQFDKVELVRFARPENAEQQLEALTGHAEEILKKLELHYRVVLLCAGDMGANAQKTYDLEVWLPAQEAYREISSCSWFGDYQARRAKIRFRGAQGEKPQLVHTFNGSALAIGRTLVAILEQYQQADGSVIVPRALVPYMGGLERIVPAAK